MIGGIAGRRFQHCKPSLPVSVGCLRLIICNSFSVSEKPHCVHLSHGLRLIYRAAHHLTGVLCVVLLAILADQSTINSQALINSLTMGLVAAFIALLLLLLWLEWGPQRRQLWLWLPILLPALPLVAGQYTLALWLNLDGSWTAVVWGHLLWVMPWMLFILQPAWQRIDSRLILIAQTLGWSRAKIFFYVKCPLMLRPALIAFAVGFSVSIAQYMPTLWLGAGRFPTLTTEAVALSSGGSNGILAAQALWQLLLPLIIFALTALVAKWVGYVRQGLR